MRKVNLFVEDFGHKTFLEALLKRLSSEHNTTIEIIFRSARGGYGTAISELKKYVHEFQQGKENLPDLLIVATDGNCKGFLKRKQQIDDVVKDFGSLVICAIPDPHIERWFLLDAAAFKKVLGRGCSAPVQKCERGLYKRLLITAVRDSGIVPLIGGLEYAEELVNAMDLERLENTGDSLSKLLKELRQTFQAWLREDQKTGNN